MPLTSMRLTPIRDTVEKDLLVLLIQDDPTDDATIRRALADSSAHGSPVSSNAAFRLRCIERLPTALARIAGGGVDAVLLEVAPEKFGPGDGLDTFRKLRAEAPAIPVVVLCGAGNQEIALKAVQSGAANYVIKEQCGSSLGVVIRAAIAQTGRQAPSVPAQIAKPAKAGGIIALLGAKGGVGTTTVSLNVASVLARRSTVVIVEMRAAFGTLAQYFQAPARIRNLSHLLQGAPAMIGPAEVRACLWPYKAIPGLTVLFGPQTAEQCREIGPDHARAIVQILAGMTDYVVVDLPAALSDANRAVIEMSHSLAVIVERDPVCVQSAKQMTHAIESWNNAPEIATVIVNRASLGSPIPLPEIDAELGHAAIGVIPPEPDLCLSAQNVRTPLVAFQAESLMASSLIALAERLTSAAAMPVRTQPVA